MKYGYARVSAEDQKLAMQLIALKKAGCKTVFKDEVTGPHVKRPALTPCLKTFQTGDTLVVWKLDRLGRSHRRGEDDRYRSYNPLPCFAARGGLSTYVAKG